jgi:flavodoxin
MNGKCLVVFYSRTGRTREVAEGISKALRCDTEEIKEAGSRKGVLGFLRSGFEAYLKRLPSINEPGHDPSSYDLVVIGTPTWASNISSPVRAYMSRYRARFKKSAFFRTGFSENEKVFKDMEALCGKKPIRTLSVTNKESADEALLGKKLAEFAAELAESLK